MQNLSDLKEQTDLSFLLSLQSNPHVVSQVIAYDMVKGTKPWPPETPAEAMMLAKDMARIISCIAPVEIVQEFILEQEEGDEEEGIE